MCMFEMMCNMSQYFTYFKQLRLLRYLSNRAFTVFFFFFLLASRIICAGFSFATVWSTETPQCRGDNTPNFSHGTSLFIATLKRQIRLVKGDPYGNIFALSFKVTARPAFSLTLSFSLFIIEGCFIEILA